MFSSPNLAQVFWDASTLNKRTLAVPREIVDTLFDFTSYYEGCNKTRIFPILGEDDLFFRNEAHAKLFFEETLRTLPAAHVGAMWRKRQQLRLHVLNVMKWAAHNPL
jgi:hypothetical protein